ncbi:hypothetical protein B0H14DRAFT_3460445 [Mycena olivaceomarginata]|nr:hypothetical protein B0H14DRAFT_3460445 [Mycena olivaceomarginata]
MRANIGRRVNLRRLSRSSTSAAVRWAVFPAVGNIGMGNKGITITSETATYQNFQDIEDSKYRVIVTNVETLMQQDGGFEKLVVWDEAHRVSKWAGFRPEYEELEAGRLRFLIPRFIPFVIVSATLPPAVLSDVMHTLQVHPSKVTIIRRSNDRPNIYFTVRETKYSMSSFKDLAFLIAENWKPGDPPPPKFLIFFDSIADSIEAAKLLRARFPIAAAPALHLTAIGLFLVEPKRLDANIAKAETRAAKKAEAGKKRKLLSNAAEQPAAKRAAVASHEAPNAPLPVPIPPPPSPLLPDKTTNPGDAPIETTDLASAPSSEARDLKQPTVLRWDPPTAVAVPAHVPAPQDGPSSEEFAEKVSRLRSHIAEISPPSYAGHDHE